MKVLPEKKILLHGMSRNGNSLIYQTFMSNDAFALYPGRMPFPFPPRRFWPAFGYTPLSAENYFETMTQEQYVFSGDSWAKSRSCRLSETGELNAQQIKIKFLARFETPNTIISQEMLPETTHAFMEEFFAANLGRGFSFAETAQYLLMDSDMSFNCSPRSFSAILGPQATYIQIIRKFHDVLASRKNLLLFYRGFRGNPAEKTLRINIIHSEFLRWLWSLVACRLNNAQAPAHYIPIHFESMLKNRKPVVEWLCKRLDVPFASDMLDSEKSHPNNYTKKHGKTLPFNTLGAVTGNAKVDRVGTRKQTFNETENDFITSMVEDYDLTVFDKQDWTDFSEGVELFNQSNAIKLSNEFLLNRWKNLHKKQLHPQVMAEFSDYHFGSAPIDPFSD
ncbi:MAG: hypothetical protein OCC46_13035 [Pseudodesulfovibrio sp.]